MSYLDRLKPCKFVSPSGAEFNLLFDDLTRTGGKKASINEILDSNDSVAQEQGNIAPRYPVELYFAEENYDELSDLFYEALNEKYTLENPGVFYNPRWGTLKVFPINFSQKEKFVDGAGRAVFDIEFVEVFPSAIFQREIRSPSMADNKKNELLIVTQSAELSLKLASAKSSVINALNDSIGKVSEVIKGILTLQNDLLDTIDSIETTTFKLLDDITNGAVLAISNIQLIMQIPVKLKDNTLNKLNNYSSLIENLCNDYTNRTEILPEAKRNNVIMAQHLIGFACASQAIAALYTEYNTRDMAITAIEIISDSYQLFKDTMDSIKVGGKSEISFSGDHNFLSVLEDIEKSASLYILEKSFSLLGVRRVTLKNDECPINICYKYYKNIDDATLELFFNSNHIGGNEFILLPSGKEIVIYG